MSTINQVTGKKYRILKDAANKIWDQISFWTSSSDVSFDDGMNAEQKVGAIKGLVTAEQSNSGYVLDATVAAIAPKVISATLRVGGDNTISITDPAITDTAKIQVFTNKYGFVPIYQTTSNHTLTITFPEPDEMVLIKVEVSEFHN